MGSDHKCKICKEGIMFIRGEANDTDTGKPIWFLQCHECGHKETERS